MSIMTLLPPVNLIATTSMVSMLEAPPAGHVDIFTLRASLISGSVDAYGHVQVLQDSGSNDGYVAWNEAVRYAQAGGAPDILVSYMLLPGYSVHIGASADGVINFHAYNRIRKIV